MTACPDELPCSVLMKGTTSWSVAEVGAVGPALQCVMLSEGLAEIS